MLDSQVRKKPFNVSTFGPVSLVDVVLVHALHVFGLGKLKLLIAYRTAFNTGTRISRPIAVA
jgi:hypothetical protein